MTAKYNIVISLYISPYEQGRLWLIILYEQAWDRATWLQVADAIDSIYQRKDCSLNRMNVYFKRNQE